MSSLEVRDHQLDVTDLAAGFLELERLEPHARLPFTLSNGHFTYSLNTHTPNTTRKTARRRLRRCPFDADGANHIA